MTKCNFDCEIGHCINSNCGRFCLCKAPIEDSCEHLWETSRTESYPLAKEGRWEPIKHATKVIEVLCKKCLKKKEI
jgi:hypothetical protein